MSAYLVSGNTIKAIVEAWIATAGEYGPARWFLEDKTVLYSNRVQDHARVAAELAAENVRSVDYRYDEKNEPVDVPPADRFGRNVDLRADPMERVKQIARWAKIIDCYCYQACEHPGWKTSAVYHNLASLLSSLLCSLPGAEEAPWGLD